MDYALKLERPSDLPADPRRWCAAAWRDRLPPGRLSALYLGAEFCEDRIPAAEEATALCTLAGEAGVEAVLLTPLVRPRGMARLARLLEALEGRGLAPSVVVNDWGVLRHLRCEHPGLRPRGGRLLNRALRDPRLSGDPGAAARVRGRAGTRGARVRDLLRSAGAVGIETDADLEGGFLGEAGAGLERALHLPYVFATTGRACLAKAATGEGSLARDLAAPCGSPCRGRCLPEVRSDTPTPLWRAGNTLFYEAAEDLALAHVARADRVVLHREPSP